ncbi:hypothetical protein GCM10018775_03260 [Streptomyces umbrinus]|nr:hypothetical protein GCM10018775_03260 [Streptomyces umbrinus]
MDAGASGGAVRGAGFSSPPPPLPIPVPFWGLRPQTPAIALNTLVLNRRTGWVGGGWRGWVG